MGMKLDWKGEEMGKIEYLKSGGLERKCVGILVILGVIKFCVIVFVVGVVVVVARCCGI